MADILTDEQVEEIEVRQFDRREIADSGGLGPALSHRVLDNVDSLIATLRHVQAENERLRSENEMMDKNSESLIDINCDLGQLKRRLQQENARLREALVNVRKRLGDFQEPWNDREREVDEIARQALEGK